MQTLGNLLFSTRTEDNFIKCPVMSGEKTFLKEHSTPVLCLLFFSFRTEDVSEMYTQTN